MQTPRSPESAGWTASIAADASRSTLNVPIRLTAITFSNGSSAWGPRLPATFSTQPIPAQQTEILRPPGAAAASFTAAATVLASLTSTRANLARSPSSSATRWPLSSFRSAMTTCAPPACRRRAVASPRPDAPPATKAPVPRICIGEPYRGRTSQDVAARAPAVTPFASPATARNARPDRCTSGRGRARRRGSRPRSAHG